ncbi:MAG: hypothetical protein M3Z66_22435, partial [Chloroflexota bacterium]|nr:hypothetical protein [Chloroflexota bacterium]
MSRAGYLLLVVLAAGTQTANAQSNTHRPSQDGGGDFGIPQAPTEPATAVVIPTVTIPQPTSVSIPTVTIPQPTALPIPTPRPATRIYHRKHHRARSVRKAAKKLTPPGTWIWAYLTSYCPASAGWIASSGQSVYYGMLANDYYSFGTRVFLPVLGITGSVEDRSGAYISWNHFDVWSPVCY